MLLPIKPTLIIFFVVVLLDHCVTAAIFIYFPRKWGIFITFLLEAFCLTVAVLLLLRLAGLGLANSTLHHP